MCNICTSTLHPIYFRTRFCPSKGLVWLHPIAQSSLAEPYIHLCTTVYVRVYVLVLFNMCNGRRAQLSGSVEGRKITAEGFVFHYIIRAKLFPKSSNYKYQRYLCFNPIVRNRVIWALPSCNPIDFFLPCGPAKFNKRCVIIKKKIIII